MQNPEQHSSEVPLPVPGGRSGNYAPYLRKLGRFFEITLSLPERSARALGALVGGTTMVLADTVIPSALRNSTTYRFTVGMFQAFMISHVAGMKEVDAGVPLPQTFVQRKMLGSGLEAAGLLTMHLSPVWVFALVSDTAHGSQVFLRRLVQILKDHGMVAADREPHSIEQLLLSIQEVANRGAAAFDMPPMSREEVSRLAAELRTATAKLATSSSALLPTFDELWTQITEVARTERLSVEEVLGILAISSGRSRGTAEAAGRTGLVLLDELVLSEYRNTLVRLREVGAVNYLTRTMEPFFVSALSHFDFDRPTLTESWYRRLRQKFISLSNRN